MIQFAVKMKSLLNVDKRDLDILMTFESNTLYKVCFVGRHRVLAYFSFARLIDKFL